MTLHTTLRRLFPAVLGLCLTWLVAETACAQYSLPQRANSGARSAQRRLLNQPAVSPYLELLAPAGQGLPTYYTRVRPQLEARQLEIQASRELQSLQSQVQSIQRQESAGGQVGTGHPTRFMNYLHYYPGLPSAR